MCARTPVRSGIAAGHRRVGAIFVNMVRNIVRAQVGQLSRKRAVRQLEDLRRVGAEGERLASVLHRSLNTQPGDTERQDWFARIETLRSELERDQTPLEIMDFGFGSPDDHRTPEQMEQGVAIQRTVSEQCGANKPAFWAALLHDLVFEYRPELGIELGTCLGVSGAYQGAAMERNGSGTFVTMEGSPALAAKSSQNLSSVGLANRVEVVEGKFSDSLPNVLSRGTPVGYAFIDGHHEHRATMDYFEKLLPAVNQHGVFVFDDINWTDGMQRAWAELSGHEAVSIAVDLGAIGVCIVDGSDGETVSLNMPLRGL